mmetsp:Transcript_2139/g.3069  ORF Transcript_2139/g.3069 Transcript_2139/m.3069 type:complete len:117 (-) Transcript_2139:284-634(-)
MNEITSSSAAAATLVLDPTKSAYKAWCIPSSQVAAWGPANLWYYTKAIVSGRTQHVQLQGEAGQLGADFVLAPGDDGTVVLAHYCRNPTDRVEVSKLFDAAVASCGSEKESMTTSQ